MSFQPKRNSLYYIKSSYSQKVISVSGGNSNNTQRGKSLSQQEPQAGEDQKWIMFALNGGVYAIANRKSGYVAETSGGNTTNGTTVIQWDYYGDSKAQNWFFTSTRDAAFIGNDKSGTTMAIKGASTANGAEIVIHSNTTDNHLWTFQDVGTFNLPPAPTVGTLPDIPRFTGPGQNLPDLTTPDVTAYTYFPCIMVQDTWGVALKINDTPYYLLKKQEYWEKVFQEDIPAYDAKESVEISGMRTTEQQAMEKTTGITVGKDAGFSFKGASASISKQVTEELKVIHSVTTEVMQQYTTKYTYTNPTAINTSYAKYQRVVEYLLLRTNGTQISSVWTVKKENDTRFTTWPANVPVSEQQLSTRTISDNELFQIPLNIDTDRQS